MDCSLPGSCVHEILHARIVGVGCHSLVQGIFPTQGLKPGLLDCRQILYCLSHQGKLGLHCNLKAYQFCDFRRVPETSLQNTGDNSYIMTTNREKKESEVPQLCLTLCEPMDYAVQNTGVVSHCLLQFPTQGANPADSLQADSLPAEPQGKPKNTGVGSLSLLQQVFPTQGLNWGFLYCRQILYQLSYQGSPF